MSSFRFAVRSLMRAGGFTSATIATVALSVGAGCTVFAIVNSVLLRPLPFAEPERLVGIWHATPGLNASLLKQSVGTFTLYREGARSFESMGLHHAIAATLGGFPNADVPVERARIAYATASTFETLRARPLIGRIFTESDEKTGAAPVALISERLWRTRFGANARVTDATLTVDGTLRRIVGVMPSAFAFPESQTPVWLPLDTSTGGYVGGFGFASIARLRTNATVAAAQRELAQLLPRLPERFPEIRPGLSTARALEQTKMAPAIHTLRDDVIGGADRVVWLIAATVAILILVAFSNVALLLLVRIEARQRELAVCSALGASWWAVLQRLVSEAMIVAFVGGAIGFGIAALAVQLIVNAAPLGIPRVAEIRVDAALLMSALALAAAFAAVSIVIAATRVRTRDVIRLLREGGRTGTSGRAGQRVRAAFVAAEVALSLVLLAGAGVLGRSVLNLRAVQPGFDPSNLFTFWTFLPPTTYAKRDDAARFYEQAIERMRQIPGVVSVAATAKLPLELEGFAYQVLVFADDGLSASNKLPPVFQTTSVTRGYFDTMRIPLLAGRTFDDEIIRHGALEAIASRGFVEHFWHDSTGRSGVGKRLRPAANGPWFTIVGVVADIRDSALTRPPVSGVYFPEQPNGDTTGLAFTAARDMAFVVRTRQPMPNLPATLRRELHALDPNLPFYRPATMEQVVADATAQLSFSLATLAAGAIAALLLGVIGLYGVIAYAVSLRTREIGIRMALGLEPGGATRMLLGQGAIVIAAGALVGLMLFLVFAKLLESITFEVASLDAPSLAGAVVLVTVLTVLATWLPARRAARIDPATALRAD